VSAGDWLALAVTAGGWLAMLCALAVTSAWRRYPRAANLLRYPFRLAWCRLRPWPRRRSQLAHDRVPLSVHDEATWWRLALSCRQRGTWAQEPDYDIAPKEQ
jgi:hypothetical protein